MTAKNHLEDRMYVYPAIAKQVMTTKQVQETLLYTDNFVMAAGRGWELNIRNLGAGMKEVSLKPKKTHDTNRTKRNHW